MAEGSGTAVATPKVAVEHLYKVYGPRPKVALRGVLAGADVPPGHTVALRDVSFAVQPGEIFVVMGLSGSGKSTLIRCINRLIPPTSGTVRIDGDEVTAMDGAQLRELRRRRVGMVFQHFALLPHRLVRDNVAFGLELQDVPRGARLEQAQRALETVGLGQWGDRYPDQLSGGMQQRVGLARALCTNPDVLLMDEPFSALDPLIRRRMQDELLDIQDRVQKTIIFITHDLDEALRLGNRIAMMHAGRVVQIGAPDDILLRPADDYVASFVEHVDRSKVLRAQDVMVEPAPLLRLGHAPRMALRALEQAGLSSAYVVGPQQRLMGILTAERAVRAVADGASDLRAAIITDVAAIEPERVLREMMAEAVAAPYPLAVVDGERHLLGIVPRVAILRALVAEAEQAEGGTRAQQTPAAEDTRALSASPS